MPSLAKARRFVALVVASTAAMAVVTFAPPAHAVGVDAVCTGGGMHFATKPGILVQPRQISVTGGSTAPSTCVGGPTVATSATITDVTAGGQIGCVSQSGVTGSATVVWSHGATSGLTVSALIPGATASAAITFKGTVTTGQYRGDNVTIVLAIPFFDPMQCLAAPGVESGDGVPTATFTQP